MSATHRFLQNKKWALVVGGIAMVAALSVPALPAEAALSNTSLVMSNNQVGASSTYTFLFSTGSAAVTDLVVMLPSTVSGLSASNTAVSTASSCTGTFSPATLSGSAVLSGDTIGLPVSIATLGTCVKVVVTGLTNPSSTGTLYSCVADGIDTTLSTDLTASNLAALTCSSSGITSSTLTSSLLSLLVTDAASLATTYVAQAVNGVTTALNVAPVLNVSLNNNYQSFNLTPSPTGVEASNATQAITVQTNAQTYSIEAQVQGSSSALTWVGPTAHSIPLGYSEATGSTPSTCSGSGTPFGSNGSYASLQNGIAGLTNSQVTNVNYCWKVDYTEPAGEYTATITYLVVPSF